MFLSELFKKMLDYYVNRVGHLPKSRKSYSSWDSNDIPLRVILSGLRGRQVILVASITLAVAFAFSSISSSFFTIVETSSKGGNLTYHVPMLADVEGGHGLSLYCFYSDKDDGIFLPEYFKSIIHNASVVELKFNEQSIEVALLGFVNYNSSVGYLFSKSCQKSLNTLSPGKIASLTLEEEITRFSWYWITASILISFLSVLFLVVGRRSNVEFSFSYLIQSGASEKRVFLELIKASIILSFLSVLFGLSVGMVSLKLVTYLIWMVTEYSIVAPMLSLWQTLCTSLYSFIGIVIAIIVPSYFIRLSMIREKTKHD
jgi:hypothetical protein